MFKLQQSTWIVLPCVISTKSWEGKRFPVAVKTRQRNLHWACAVVCGCGRSVFTLCQSAMCWETSREQSWHKHFNKRIYNLKIILEGGQSSTSSNCIKSLIAILDGFSCVLSAESHTVSAVSSLNMWSSECWFSCGGYSRDWEKYNENWFK